MDQLLKHKCMKLRCLTSDRDMHRVGIICADAFKTMIAHAHVQCYMNWT